MISRDFQTPYLGRDGNGPNDDEDYLTNQLLNDDPESPDTNIKKTSG